MEALAQMRIAGATINGLLHVGAHKGQERLAYQAAGVSPVIYVEPENANFASLKEHLAGMEGHLPVQALCASQNGKKVRLNISSNDGESSSIFDLGHHGVIFPQITYTSHQEIVSVTVDSLMTSLSFSANLLVIDTQGAELSVLQGATSNLINNFVGVYAEVSEKPLYAGSCTFEQVTSFLYAFGFRLRWLNINGWGHGDAFYIKRVDETASS